MGSEFFFECGWLSPHWLGSSQCNENLIYVFLFWELCSLSPNFHIHVSVCDLYIPRIGPHISCSRIGRSIVGIHKSLTDTWMWKLGLRSSNFFSGNICFDFSVLVLYRVPSSASCEYFPNFKGLARLHPPPQQVNQAFLFSLTSSYQQVSSCAEVLQLRCIDRIACLPGCMGRGRSILSVTQECLCFELWLFSNCISDKQSSGRFCLDLEEHSLLWISAHEQRIITIFITYHHPAPVIIFGESHHLFKPGVKVFDP